MAWRYFPLQDGVWIKQEYLQELRDGMGERAIAVPALLARGSWSPAIRNHLSALQANISQYAGSFLRVDSYSGPTSWSFKYYTSSAQPPNNNYVNIFTEVFGQGVTGWPHPAQSGYWPLTIILNDIYRVIDKLRWRYVGTGNGGSPGTWQTPPRPSLRQLVLEAAPSWWHHFAYRTPYGNFNLSNEQDAEPSRPDQWEAAQPGCQEQLLRTDYVALQYQNYPSWYVEQSIRCMEVQYWQDYSAYNWYWYHAGYAGDGFKVFAPAVMGKPVFPTSTSADISTPAIKDAYVPFGISGGGGGSASSPASTALGRSLPVVVSVGSVASAGQRSLGTVVEEVTVSGGPYGWSNYGMQTNQIQRMYKFSEPAFDAIMACVSPAADSPQCSEIGPYPTYPPCYEVPGWAPQDPTWIATYYGDPHTEQLSLVFSHNFGLSGAFADAHYHKCTRD